MVTKQGSGIGNYVVPDLVQYSKPCGESACFKGLTLKVLVTTIDALGHFETA